MPEISIIIPVYNGEKYLEACVDSVLAQTFRDFELLIVNDGSKDRTEEILDRYARQDARVHVITQENAGVSAARNHALREAKGDYIAFLDADDWTAPETFAGAVDIAAKYGADVVLWNKVQEYPDHQKVIPYSDAERLIADPQEVLDLRWQMFTEFDKDGKRIYGTRTTYGKLIRRRIPEENGIRFDEKLRQHEDTLFMLEIYEKANSFYITNAAWYHRRVEEGSLSSRYSPYVVENNAEAALHMERFLRENGKSEEYFDFFKSVLVYWLIQDFDLAVFHQQNPAPKAEQYRQARQILNSEPFASAFRTMPKSPLVIRSKRVYIALARRKLVRLLAAYSRLYKWARIRRRDKFKVR